MRREENWAIAPERIRDFFRQQPDVTEEAETFFFRGCRICLIPCEGVLLHQKQQRTILILEGPEEAVQRIYQRFFLRFLSAGG